MLVLAHRGCHADAPANSAEALAAARPAGFDGVAFDVRRCGSGELVLSRDAVVAGYPLRALSLDELRKAVPGLATLAEAARVCRRDGAWVNAELRETGIAAETLSVLSEACDGVLLTSPLTAALREVADIVPRSHLGLHLCPEADGRGWFRQLAAVSRMAPARLACPSWDVWQRLSLAFVPSRTVVLGPPAGETGIRRMANAGVFAAVTDHPEHAAFSEAART